MKILARHKDLNNIVFGYTIENENGQQFLERDALLSYVGMVEIENAYLTKDKDFKAKDGFHIKTIKEKCNKAVAHTNNGYYGEGVLEASKIIRKLTSENKVIINRTIEEVNIHLARVLNDCGLTTEAFIKNYLSVIQPYMLSKDSNNKYRCNIGYGIALCLTLNTNGVCVWCSKSNIIAKDYSNKACAVILDSGYNLNEMHSHIVFSVQIGCMKYKYETVAKRCNNNRSTILKYREINKHFREITNSALKNLKYQYRKSRSKDDEISIYDIIKLYDTMEVVGCDLDYFELIINAYDRCNSDKEKLMLLNILYNVIFDTRTKHETLKNNIINNCKIKNNMYTLILSIL